MSPITGPLTPEQRAKAVAKSRKWQQARQARGECPCCGAPGPHELYACATCRARHRVAQKETRVARLNRPVGRYTCGVCGEQGHNRLACPEGRKESGAE